MRCMYLICLVMVYIISTPSILLTTGDDEAKDCPLTAYKTQKVPKIDGIISPGEWNDTLIYEYVRNNTAIMNGRIKLQCALKYDEKWLYILFKVNDDDFHSEPPTDTDVVSILTKPVDESGRADKAFLVLHNDSTDIIKNATMARTGFFINWSSSPIGEANSTYSNKSKEYTFEIKISVLYLQTNNSYVPFNIEFTERLWLYGPATVSVGDSRYTRPGLILSSSYYTGVEKDELQREKTPEDMKVVMERVLIGVSIIVTLVSLGLLLLLKRRTR